MRLNKFLSTAGVAARRKADDIIAAGRVSVNGKIVTSLGAQVNEKKDEVAVDGKRISLPLSFVYIKLHKPKGYACTNSDEKGRKTIFDLVPSSQRLFSIGRLDYDTEGLIILTNDGDFANKVSHPSGEIEKEYIVKIEGDIKQSELAVLRNGVVIDGQRLPKAKVKVAGIQANATRLSVVIHEGLNHQVRKMFEAIGKNITLLKRVRIGGVKLGGLKRGEYKPLKPYELDQLIF